MSRCILCGKSPTLKERVDVSNPSRFLSIYSLRWKIFERKDHPLKSYFVHSDKAHVVLNRGNGWHRLPCYALRDWRPRERTVGVLNGKLYWDDFPHHSQACEDPHCEGRGLTPAETNFLMGIKPAKRSPIPAATRRLVLAQYGHTCARCGTSSDVELHHRLAVVHGGTNDPHNLVPLCHSCRTQHAQKFTVSVYPDLKKIFLESEQ